VSVSPTQTSKLSDSGSGMIWSILGWTDAEAPANMLLKVYIKTMLSGKIELVFTLKITEKVDSTWSKPESDNCVRSKTRGLAKESSIFSQITTLPALVPTMHPISKECDVTKVGIVRN